VVLPNKRVERRLIFVGPIVEGKIIVEKGLEAGEQLILHGINKVYHGSLADPIAEAEYEAQLLEQETARLNKPGAEAPGEGGENGR
jgi:membrane fusion protein, multidrug efflux system